VTKRHDKVRRNEYDTAKRFKGGLSITVSPIAVAVMLLAASPQMARAADECGPEGGGADAITCSGASYSTGIQYTGSDGLTLNLNNPAMVVQANAGAANVFLQGGAVNTRALAINATSLTSVTGVGRAAITINNPRGGNGSITIDGGSFSANTGSVVNVANALGSGNVQVTMNAGQVSNTGNGFSSTALAANASGTATGNAGVMLTGGTVQTAATSSQAVRASITNLLSSAHANATMTGGSIDSGGSGLLSSNSGDGDATTTMTGGTVLARNGSGLVASIASGGKPGAAKVVMQGGSVTAEGNNAIGISSQTNGSGQAIVQMSGGTVDALLNNGDGIRVSSVSGSYAVDVSGGAVSGGAGFGAGIHTAAAVGGGTVNIGAGAIINAGASGVAIRDGDFNRDGIDETGGNATITTAGTINGAIVLGGGTDSVTVTGGAINGNITGDGPDTLALNLGSGSFTYGAGVTISGMSSVTMNSGTAQINGVIEGATTVTVNGGTLGLNGANTYTGGTALRQGRINLGHNQALGTGALAMDDGTTLGFSVDGLTIGNDIQLTGSNDPAIDTGAFSETLAGAISGGGFITKQGSGTLTLTGANSYTGATNVAQGTLRAGAANTFSAGSAHNVATGATLDLAGFNQSVASLTNSGAVTLVGPAPGTTLTVNGPYVGHNGVLRLGTALGADGSMSDRMVLNGATAIASGSTTVQVVNLSGLGALTSGNGIEVISAQNGATTTAQTTRSAFALAGGHVDAGAYEYRLYAADASGAGENWFLRSNVPAVTPPTTPGTPVVPTAPVITYRAEASLYAALPNQLRQGNLAMLGDLHKRVGDDNPRSIATAATGTDRRAWGRVFSTDIDIQQGGSVSPTSKGRFTGFQAGTDLLVMPNWRAGLYVGQLDGDATVNGFASGVNNLRVGHNDVRSRYLGVYGTYTGDSGFYADAVVQSGRHRYTVEPMLGGGASGKGNSLLGSIEVGQAFALGGSGWSIEPQLQLIHQHLDLGNSAIIGAVVQPEADTGWIARAGVRVKGQVGTGLGALQPYGRFNVYKTSSGTDIASFVNGATRTGIAASIGGTSTELAGGFTLALSQSTSLYGEIGKLWSSGGDAKVKSSINGSLGVRVNW